MNGKIVVSKPLYVALAQRKEDRRARLQVCYFHLCYLLFPFVICQSAAMLSFLFADPLKVSLFLFLVKLIFLVVRI